MQQTNLHAHKTDPNGHLGYLKICSKTIYIKGIKTNLYVHIEPRRERTFNTTKKDIACPNATEWYMQN